MKRDDDEDKKYGKVIQNLASLRSKSVGTSRSSFTF